MLIRDPKKLMRAREVLYESSLKVCGRRKLSDGKKSLILDNRKLLKMELLLTKVLVMGYIHPSLISGKWIVMLLDLFCFLIIIIIIIITIIIDLFCTFALCFEVFLFTIICLLIKLISSNIYIYIHYNYNLIGLINFRF